MHQWIASIEINSAINKTWNVLTDFENSHLWNPYRDKVVILSPEGFGKNSVIEIRNGSVSCYLITDHYEEPNYLRMKVVSNRSKGFSEFVLTENLHKTKLDVILNLELRGVSKFISIYYGMRLQKELRAIKKWLENV